MGDKINPSHYKQHPSGVECIRITEHYGFNLGNTIKYIWRAGLKEGSADLEDLRKARWYLDREILRREGTSPAPDPVAPPGVATAGVQRPDSDAFLAALREAWPCHQTKDGTWQAMSGLYFAGQDDPGPPVAARWKCSPAKEKAIREAMKSIAKKGGYEDEGNRQAALDGSTMREGGNRE